MKKLLSYILINLYIWLDSRTSHPTAIFWQQNIRMSFKCLLPGKLSLPTNFHVANLLIQDSQKSSRFGVRKTFDVEFESSTMYMKNSFFNQLIPDTINRRLKLVKKNTLDKKLSRCNKLLQYTRNHVFLFLQNHLKAKSVLFYWHWNVVLCLKILSFQLRVYIKIMLHFNWTVWKLQI